MKFRFFPLWFWMLIFFFQPFHPSEAAAQTTPEVAAQVGPNYSVMAGKCEMERDEATGIITKYVGDCHLERQNESSGAVSSNNPDRRLYCFNDYKLTGNYQGAVIGGPTADSWVGCSMCVGERCESFLIPGFPKDGTEFGMNSEIKKGCFNGAADPVVTALPGGAFAVTLLTFRRDYPNCASNAPESGIFQQIIVDKENSEDQIADSIAFMPQITVALSNEQFVDKPDAAFIPASNPSSQMCTIGEIDGISRKIPCGKLLTAFTTFTGDTTKNTRSKINLCTHDFADGTRDRCVRADDSQHVDSGVALATDPSDLNRIYLFWRQFDPGTARQGNILQAISTDGGATIGKGQVIFPLVTFGDLPKGLPSSPTPENSIIEKFVLARSTAFLTSAVAHVLGTQTNPVNLCWGQRFENVEDTFGAGQIVCSKSTDGGSVWSTPVQMDPSTRYQFQPALDCAAGQCSLAWYDMRKSYNPLQDLPADYLGNNFSYDNQPWYTPTGPVHTVDVRMTQWEAASPYPQSSFQISKYPMIVVPNADETDLLWVQLQVNPLNPLTNCGGKCAFFGDYMDVFYSKWVRDASSGSVAWKLNTDSTGPRDVWASYTSNQNIRYPDDGKWSEFLAPNPLTSTTQSCTPDRYGMHNQDVYTAHISPGSDGFNVACPRCTKPPGDGERTFVLVLENTSTESITLEAKIVNAEPEVASFYQTLDGIINPQETTATILPFGKKTRTVFVTCGVTCPLIEVEVTNTTKNVTKTVLLNGVSEVFPDSAAAGSEIHNLSLLNEAPNLSLLNLSLLNDPEALSLLNLSLLNNPENLSLLNLSLLNGGEQNLSLLNSSDTNLSLLNLSLLNTTENLSLLNLSLLNTTANLSLLNLSLLNAPPESGNVAMKTWEVSSGNTSVTSGYDFAFLSEEGGEVLDGFDAYAVVTRTRPVASVDSCGNRVYTPGLAGEEILAAVPLTSTSSQNAEILTPGDLAGDGFTNLSLKNSSLDDLTYFMNPEDTIQITLVVQPKTGTSGSAVDALNNIDMFTVSQASNGGTFAHNLLAQKITIITDAPSSATYGSTFTVEAISSSGLPVTYDSDGKCTNVGATFTLESGIGECTVIYEVASSEIFESATTSTSVTVTKATSETTVTCTEGPFTYTGSEQKPCSATYLTSDGLEGSLEVGYLNNINAGTATASATYPGDDNHETSEGIATFTIGQASSTTTIICPASVTYTGSALTPCTAKVTGAGGLDQPLAVSYSDNINAGKATASASFAEDDNHTGSIGIATFTISPAGSTVTVTCPASVTYNGAAQIPPCTAKASGVGMSDVVLTVSYANNTNAGTATASAGYDGDANHIGSIGIATFTISPAGSTVTVTCPASVTYNGAAQTPCTATVTGAGGLSQTLPVVTYSNNINAGTATASATYAGDPNHTGSSGNANFTIDKAATTVTLSPSSTPVEAGRAVTLTATVSHTTSGTPGGTITFKEGSTSLGTATLSGGKATLTLSNLAVGDHTITAEYSGDANFLPNSVLSSASVKVTFRFDGFYPKLGTAANNEGGTSAYGPFKLGSVITAKWALFDGNNNFYSGDIANAEIYLLKSGIRYTLKYPNQVPGATVFRIDFTKPQYIFNWDTSKPLPGNIPIAPGDYIFVVKDGSGGFHSVTVKITK